jgi:predicted tellurium resistance membrane protein TerC
MFEIPDFSSLQIILSFLTLTFLEIVLGVDNIIFISITSAKLDVKERKKATTSGLVAAMVLRIILLFGLSFLTAMQKAVINIETSWIQAGFSVQSLILILGGMFLMYKSVSEIHHKLETEDEAISNGTKNRMTLSKAIFEITLINLIFSLDSILTAVGMTNGLHGALIIMILAVVLSIVIMIAFANPVGKFVNDHPTVQMLGLSFLILIGFMLIAEGGHLAHLTVAGGSIGAIPKGYLYFAIAFALLVEFLNMRLRKKRVKPVQLHGIQEDAKEAGYFNSNKT